MPFTITKMARPSSFWQESYVRIQKGQRLVIEAEGAWSPDGKNRTVWCGADGIPNLTGNDDFPLPGSNVGMLIAKIRGEVIAVGSRYDNPAPESGVIFMAMNENPAHNNQAGYLLAQIITFD